MTHPDAVDRLIDRLAADLLPELARKLRVDAEAHHVTSLRALAEIIESGAQMMREELAHDPTSEL